MALAAAATVVMGLVILPRVLSAPPRLMLEETIRGDEDVPLVPSGARRVDLWVPRRPELEPDRPVLWELLTLPAEERLPGLLRPLAPKEGHLRFRLEPANLEPGRYSLKATASDGSWRREYLFKVPPRDG